MPPRGLKSTRNRDVYPNKPEQRLDDGVAVVFGYNVWEGYTEHDGELPNAKTRNHLE